MAPKAYLPVCNRPRNTGTMLGVAIEAYHQGVCRACLACCGTANACGMRRVPGMARKDKEHRCEERMRANEDM